jgi:S-adenosylmethionine:tRNA-ribosyltransferase-isomerase (queuine synthetase)
MSSLLSIVHNVYGDNWHHLYNYAIESGLKFLSFGDAVLFKIDE